MVDPFRARRYTSVDSASGVLVPKEFVFDQKGRNEGAFLEENTRNRVLRSRLVRDLLIGIIMLECFLIVLFYIGIRAIG